MRMNTHSTYNIEDVQVGVVAVTILPASAIAFGAESFS
jgi:hypothetical protein